MCHTTLQYYIHCRHTNLSFQHCHLDPHPSTSFTSPSANFHPPAHGVPSHHGLHQHPQQNTSPGNTVVSATHPNYAPNLPPQSFAGPQTLSSPTTPAIHRRLTDTEASYRSHDTRLSVAHSYRRKCAACVAAEIRDLVHGHREGVRRERALRWMRRVEREEEIAGGSGSDDGVGREEGAGAALAALAATAGRRGGRRDDEMARRAVVEWQRYADRSLVEEGRRANRESRRARRVQSDGVFDDGDEDGDDESNVETQEAAPTRLTASADAVSSSQPRTESPVAADDGRVDQRAAEERRQILQAEQRRAPETIEASIDPSRLGPRVRQRQVDLMEQARQYELQIWSQRNERGGLTDRQRELLTSGPLLAPIPDDRMVDVETALREITGSPAGMYPPNMTAMQVETYRRWGVYSMLQNARRTPPPASTAHAQIDELDDRVLVRGTSAVVDENRSPRARGLRVRGEDVVMTDGSDETPALDGLQEGDAGAGEKLEIGQVQNSERANPSDPGVRLRDMPTIAVDREPGQNREAWEIGSTSAGIATEDTDTGHAATQTGQTKLETTTPAEMATSNCPCHQPFDYQITSNLPTHSSLLFGSTSSPPPTLAILRDSPFHATLPLFLGREELSSNTHEILVSFQACGHNLAVFVPRLEYIDASHIRAACGCYGFDRCLMAARRAKSLQECLVCRMKKEREGWARMMERDGMERCPWFERWVRVVERPRELALWPYGARDDLLEM